MDGLCHKPTYGLMLPCYRFSCLPPSHAKGEHRPRFQPFSSRLGSLNNVQSVPAARPRAADRCRNDARLVAVSKFRSPRCRSIRRPSESVAPAAEACPCSQGKKTCTPPDWRRVLCRQASSISRRAYVRQNELAGFTATIQPPIVYWRAAMIGSSTV